MYVYGYIRKNMYVLVKVCKDLKIKLSLVLRY